MAAPEKTPARRFLPPSSSAASRSSGLPSVRRHALALSQSNFAPSSASPSARTSRFETPARRERDEIQTSFEDGSSPSLPTRQSHVAMKGDFIVDDKDDDGKLDFGLPNVGPTTEETDIVRPAVAHSEDYDADIPEPPSHKRRKLASSAQSPKPTITISSSSSSSTSKHEDINPDPDEPDQYTSDVESAPLSELRTPQTTSRFRSVAPVHPTEGLINVSKRAFRALSTKARLDLEASTVLPDAFSPSRRKGKREYTPGGLADTVRSWVLGAASEEVQRGRMTERRLAVRHAESDASGRVVHITDEDGQDWLLVGKYDGMDRSLTRKVVERTLKEGSVIIRGTSTTWAVADVKGRQVQVAAHWDFPP